MRKQSMINTSNVAVYYIDFMITFTIIYIFPPFKLCNLLTDGFAKRDVEDEDDLIDEDRDRFERDVILNCCDKDLCNFEIEPTTVTKHTTTAATITVTATKPKCKATFSCKLSYKPTQIKSRTKHLQNIPGRSTNCQTMFTEYPHRG